MPFMVTEYGPLGFWEKPSTEWGREIEEPSGVKAKGMATRIQLGIVNNQSGKLIGNYASYGIQTGANAHLVWNV